MSANPWSHAAVFTRNLIGGPLGAFGCTSSAVKTAGPMKEGFDDSMTCLYRSSGLSEDRNPSSLLEQNGQMREVPPKSGHLGLFAFKEVSNRRFTVVPHPKHQSSQFTMQTLLPADDADFIHPNR